MKKSTIFLLALIYIVSFIVVGFFGMNPKTFDDVRYVTDIEVTPLDQTQGFSVLQLNFYNEEEKYYCDYYKLTYSTETVVRFATRIKPDNCTYNTITYNCIDNNYVNYEIEDGIIYATFLEQQESVDLAVVNFNLVSNDGKEFTKYVSVVLSFTKK